MRFDKQGKLIVNKQQINWPNLINEGQKYGLSEAQLSRLRRYLNDKRMVRIIGLEQFNRNARAWLSALTGIIADVLAIDAHVSIWMNKKLEKPRNWILNKLTSVVPTQIDDIAFKALQVAQQFADDTLLPFKEKVLTKVSSKMHDKYDYHNDATYLGLTLKEQKDLAKARLKESKEKAKDAFNTLNKRKLQTALIGKYKDEAGNWINMRKYSSPQESLLLRRLQTKQIIERNKKNEDRSKQETPQEGEIHVEEGTP